jgi:hypothetical protein
MYNIIQTLSFYYTSHAIVYHFLYFIGLIPSTKYIAYTVLIFSQILNYIYPKYISITNNNNKIKYLLIDFCAHILPGLILFYYNHNKIPFIDLTTVSILLFSLILYFWYIYIYSKKSIVDIYINNNPFKIFDI